jgi:Putative zinc-binding metallo-peptidase
VSAPAGPVAEAGAPVAEGQAEVKAPAPPKHTRHSGAKRALREVRHRRRMAPSEWESWDDERLLGLRLCDLDLRIAGTSVEPLVAQVLAELAERGLRFRPHFWLSDEWFTPDGVPGAAIPFYLAHPRLARLEQSQMLEVEGGTPEWCLRILRHEVGHAIENAYRLRRLKRRIQHFGRSSQKYPEDYAPRPYSKSYVTHLGYGYAQSHPDEDFAETFAVWLTPGSDWAERYAGWKALRKLHYVDELMRGLAGQRPKVTTRREVEPLRALRRTLREHYEARRGTYGVAEPERYDRDLRRLFSASPEHGRNPSAARFISRMRREARRLVRRWTGVYQYTIDQVLSKMIGRCRALNLRLVGTEEHVRQEFLVLLAVRVVNDLHSGRHRLAL